MSKTTNISPNAAKEMVERGEGVIVDVRTIGEALEEHVPGSVFLPFDLVSRQRIEDMGGAGKTPIMLCRSGRRAAEAGEALAQQMDSVAVLEGGIDSWKQQNLPVVTGKKVMPLERQVLVTAGSMLLLFTLLGLLVSPWFFAATLFMCCGLIFAGITGTCGMARVLIMMPWNKKPLCGGTCERRSPSAG